MHCTSLLGPLCANFHGQSPGDAPHFRSPPRSLHALPPLVCRASQQWSPPQAFCSHMTGFSAGHRLRPPRKRQQAHRSGWVFTLQLLPSVHWSVFQPAFWVSQGQDWASTDARATRAKARVDFMMLEEFGIRNKTKFFRRRQQTIRLCVCCRRFFSDRQRPSAGRGKFDPSSPRKILKGAAPNQSQVK